jgi:hypothetical protein
MPRHGTTVEDTGIVGIEDRARARRRWRLKRQPQASTRNWPPWPSELPIHVGPRFRKCAGRIATHGMHPGFPPRRPTHIGSVPPSRSIQRPITRTALSAITSDNRPASLMSALERRGCGSLFQSMGAEVAEDLSGFPLVCVCTRGAALVSDSRTDPNSSVGIQLRQERECTNEPTRPSGFRRNGAVQKMDWRRLRLGQPRPSDR